MTGSIFVDTNVLVYARDSAHAEKQAAAMRWVDTLWREQSGRTSTQVLSELYVTLTRKLRPGMRPNEAWDEIEALLAWDPLPVDRELMIRAREVEARYRLAWWDSMIVAAAQLQDCHTLLTEDLQHGMSFGAVTVRNPFVSRAAEVPAPYVGETGIARRHRPRGRPRKSGALAAG
jgi:predicted nucleic acid-binding protein